MITLYITTIEKVKDNNIFEHILSNASNYSKEKYLSYKSEQARFECIAATYLIDEYLKTQKLNEKDMEYGVTEKGKPYFKNNKDIYFSISHSKNLVGVAFSDKEVGFDIQVVKRVTDNLFKRVLSEEELAAVGAKLCEPTVGASSKSPIESIFFYNWVKKEAILKRDGTGLVNDMINIHDEYGIVKKIIYNTENNNINVKDCNTGNGFDEEKDKRIKQHNIKYFNELYNKKFTNIEKYNINDIEIYYCCANNSCDNDFNMVIL